MGIVFSDKQKRAQIKELLYAPGGMLILRRLQAGRCISIAGVNVPYRLSDDELKLLQNEYIYYEQDGDGTMYARFEKPVNEIRAILGLEPQDMLGNPIKVENLEEEMELDEDKIFVGKLGQMLDLPNEIKLLDKNIVEKIIELMEPEELFEVGYVNPVYFYKELWEELPIYKCTEMMGYTGIDFAWSKDDGNWADQNARVAAAKQQIAKADEIEQTTGQKTQTLHVSNTEYSKQNKLVHRYQTVNNQDDPDNPIKVEQNTLLFYPVGKPKICYWIKLPNRPDLGFIKVTTAQLEKYVYEQLDKIEDKLRVKLGQAKDKVHKYLQTADNWGKTALDIDRETRANVDFEKASKYIYKYEIDKSAVRALYTTQFYFLSTPVWATQGGRIAESLEETLERNPFDLFFEDINAYGEKLNEAKEEICCICGEPIEGYGNNPAPYKKSGLCCDACNAKFVIPARLAQLESPEENTEE